MFRHAAIVHRRLTCSLLPSVLTLAAWLCATSVLASPPVRPAAQRPMQALIPAHTLVPVVCMTHLKSGHCHAGDDVVYRTFFTVYGPRHEVLIPAGSEAHGKVTESQGSGYAGKGGKLKFTCDYVVAGDNAHIPFSDTDLSRQGRTANAATLILGAGVFGYFSKGKDIDVDEGTPFMMEVATDTAVASMPDASLGDVRIVPNKHKAKGYPATVTGFTADSVTVVTDKGESTLKLQDVKQILLPSPKDTISSAAPPPSVAPLVPTAPATPIAVIAAPVPPAQPIFRTVAPAPASLPLIGTTRQVFLLKNNVRVTGTLLRYNGFFFWVGTAHGTKKINAHSVAAISTDKL